MRLWVAPVLVRANRLAIASNPGECWLVSAIYFLTDTVLPPGARAVRLNHFAQVDAHSCASTTVIKKEPGLSNGVLPPKGLRAQVRIVWARSAALRIVSSRPSERIC